MKPEQREITYEEIRAMSWQAITANSKGIIYYAFHWLHPEGRELMKRWNLHKFAPRPSFDVQWRRLCEIASEIRDWQDVILSEEKAPDIAVEGKNVSHICKSLGGRRYMFMVNSDYAPSEVKIQTEAGERRLSFFRSRQGFV